MRDDPARVPDRPLRRARTATPFMGAILGAGTALFLLVVRRLRPRARRVPARCRRPSAPTPAGSRPCAIRTSAGCSAAFTLSAIAGAVPATLVIYVSVYVIGTPEWWERAHPELAADLVVLPAASTSSPACSRCRSGVASRAARQARRPGASRSRSRRVTSAACWWLDEGSDRALHGDPRARRHELRQLPRAAALDGRGPDRLGRGAHRHAARRRRTSALVASRPSSATPSPASPRSRCSSTSATCPASPRARR